MATNRRGNAGGGEVEIGVEALYGRYKLRLLGGAIGLKAVNIADGLRLEGGVQQSCDHEAHSQYTDQTARWEGQSWNKSNSGIHSEDTFLQQAKSSGGLGGVSAVVSQVRPGRPAKQAVKSITLSDGIGRRRAPHSSSGHEPG